MSHCAAFVALSSERIADKGVRRPAGGLQHKSILASLEGFVEMVAVQCGFGERKPVFNGWLHFVVEHGFPFVESLFILLIVRQCVSQIAADLTSIWRQCRGQMCLSQSFSGPSVCLKQCSQLKSYFGVVGLSQRGVFRGF